MRIPTDNELKELKSPDLPKDRAQFLFSFVGSGRLFSDVVLRTIETEFDDVRAVHLPDLDTWALVQRSGTRFGHLQSRMLIVDERDIERFARFVRDKDPLLENVHLVIAARSTESARRLLTFHGTMIADREMSILPMNVNLTTWIQLVRAIDCGANYLPSTIMFPGRTDAQSAPNETPETTDTQMQATEADIPERDSVGEAQAKPKFTPREAQVLKLVAAGQPNKVIANELDVSAHTVKLHIHRIIAKLGVHNRTEAAIWYHQTRHD